ncbi:MAG: LPXTG cell wall anchor domain-containing protein [Phycisphaera sp.]|nr:LPXTG cell wall anchor domain-containing protein [Phycisphaera sp.]
MQVDSASQGGAPGAWSGLGYDFDELGTYSVSIAIWDNTSGNMDTVGTLSMDIVVEGSQAVPGVGGLAALGGLGLVGRRRRR